MNQRSVIAASIATLICLLPQQVKSMVVYTSPINYQQLNTPEPKINKDKTLTLNYLDINKKGEKVVTSVKVYPLVNKSNVALTDNGRAYIINPLPPKGILGGKSVYMRAPLNWYGSGPMIIFKPTQNEMILPSPLDHRAKDYSYKANKNLLSPKGFKVLGQFGTAFKAFTSDKKAQPLRYFSFVPKELKTLTNNQNAVVGSSAPNILQAGIVGYKNGTIEYLDFSKQQGKGKNWSERLEYIKKQIIKPKLESLEKDPKVLYVSIDNHAVIRDKADIPAVVVRGEYKRGGPFLDHKSGGYQLKAGHLRLTPFLLLPPSARMPPANLPFPIGLCPALDG